MSGTVDGWQVVATAQDRRSARCLETLLSLSDGTIGLRGSREERPPDESPALLASGVYVGSGPDEHLLDGPWPLGLPGEPVACRRVLDLRHGVLTREPVEGTDGLRTQRFLSAHRQGVFAMRVEGLTGGAGAPLTPPPTAPMTSGASDGSEWARTHGEHGGVVAVAWQSDPDAGTASVDRLVAYESDPRRPPSLAAARRRLLTARRLGFDALLQEHRAAWEARWRLAGVDVPDDPAAEQALRYALFQLWSCATPEGESAVGARGLTGRGYSGHVFWDTDVFVLPALVTLSPALARSLLAYRIARLPRARDLARRRGLQGARFPWESAADGDDVTPTSGWSNGEWVPIFTGALEEHVVADVAWAAYHYAAWSGDDAFPGSEGRDLVLDGARYWCSRSARDPDGSAHLRHVIGPDEYHEDVDDNAFTNLMARWHLRRAAELTEDPDEARRWQDLADALVDMLDPTTRRHEQFRGYDALVALRAEDVATPPFAADLLLGMERTSHSQLLKQNDVLMAHHLLGPEMPEGSLLADLAHYLPRTTHGSSLSPAVSAAQLARAGRPDEALRLLDVALRLDLDDLGGMTAAGLHLATLGGVWQALLVGFLGASVDRQGCLLLDPCLPSRWPSLTVRFQCRGSTVTVRADPDTIEVVARPGLRVRGPCGAAQDVSGRAVLRGSPGTWEVGP